MRTRSLFLPLLLVATALAAAASCEDQRSYVYTAMKFEPDNGCLEAYAPVEVVPGAGANATCAPTCMTVGSDLYVSTVCPPLPAIATAVDSDAAPCLEALDAEQQEAACGSGSAPGDDSGDDGSEPSEAGDEDGPGDDGGGDAGTDAPEDVAEAG